MMLRVSVGRERFGLVCLALSMALMPGASRAQLPTPTPNAKACAYLPVAELEAHFKSKAQNVRGLDQTTRNTCTAQLPDMWHTAAIESHPSSAADLAMSVEQRLAFLKQGMKNLETRDFGSIGCFRTTVDMGKPVTVVTCFLAKAPYLSIALQSPDAAQLDFEATKTLLEKMAARRQ